MEISIRTILYLRILTALLMILAIVAVGVMKRRRSLSHVKAYAIIASTFILNSAVQLSGRPLAGADGLIIALNLVVIVAWLIGLQIVLWRAESKGPNKTLNPDAQKPRAG